MTSGAEIHAVSLAKGVRFDDEGTASAGMGLAKWLGLAATPTFAVMAVLTGLDQSPMHMICSSGHGASLSGMVPMYLLMSAFHLPPWLKLIFGRRDLTWTSSGPGCSPGPGTASAHEARVAKE